MVTNSVAAFLASNVSVIAGREDAGQCFDDIHNVVDAIERMINRPEPDQFCGKCMISFEGAPCDLALYAPRAATEVVCPRCKTSHSIEKLFENTLDDADDKSFTISELHRLILPAVREYVPPRTLQHWAARGSLVPTGYDANAEPRFLLADVRRLRDARPQNGATGATVHKKRAS